MTQDTQTNNPDSSPSETSPFEGLSNTELAVIRTDLAQSRTDLANQRTSLAEQRTDLAEQRTERSTIRTDLARDRNRLAAERTLMAWIRTSLSMISFGFGIDRFFSYLDKTDTSTNFDQLSEERLLGLSLITLGVFALAGALIQHWRTLKRIEEKEYKYAAGGSLGLIVAIVLVFIGVATYIPILTGGTDVTALVSLNSPLIQNLAAFTVFTIMFSVGLSLPWQDVFSLWGQGGLLVRSLLATVIIPPIVIALVIWGLPLSANFAYALVLFAACPAPPLLTKRASVAGASLQYTTSLQVTLALLAIGITPLILYVFGLLFIDVQTVAFPTLIAKQIALAQFLPLVLGLGLRSVFADVATEINILVKTVANTLFILLAIAALIISVNVLPSFGWFSFAVTAILSVSGLAIGHLLGKQQPPEVQSGLAVAVIARNLGLILFIVTANQRIELIPYCLGILVVGFIVGAPYSAWMKRNVKQLQVSLS